MSHRRVTVFITPEVLTGLYTPSLPGVWVRTNAGLPADAKLIGRGYDFESDRFYLTFEHPQFPESAEGERLPVFDGVEMEAFCFESPASAKAIEALNRATARQTEIAKLAEQQAFVKMGWRVLPMFNLNALVDAGEQLPTRVDGFADASEGVAAPVHVREGE